MNCSHIETVRNDTVARSVRAPGGWGAEESGTRSEPGPEATADCFAGQLGACLSEIGRLYETANERVIRCVQNAAADCTNFNCRFFAQILRAELKPAGAP